ncbi:Hypothetical protein UVM_LOCUS172 [uncultured virus]|nr:Hypothetical protein UVM_LOCUS172 [uncultured virus]
MHALEQACAGRKDGPGAIALVHRAAQALASGDLPLDVGEETAKAALEAARWLLLVESSVHELVRVGVPVVAALELSRRVLEADLTTARPHTIFV